MAIGMKFDDQIADTVVEKDGEACANAVQRDDGVGGDGHQSRLVQAVI